MIGFIGGRFGWELSAKGEDVAVEFALGEVIKLVGSRARDSFVKGHLTRWDINPWTRGAYAAAVPGHFGARAELAQSVGDRLFFAGEATAAPYMQLCGGAYLSGQMVAEDLIATIG